MHHGHPGGEMRSRNKWLDKNELLAEHGAGTIQQLLDLSHLVEYLHGAILSRSYRIPDDLNGAIGLTRHGRKIQQELVTKHDVPAKEARVMCLLVGTHTEPLIDTEQTDFAAIESSISNQIKDRRILHPFSFGRELYDRAASLFDDARSYLNYEDTLRLLEDTSIGVFHVGKYLCGPFGVLITDCTRFTPPKLRIPLFHCPELTCSTVHKCTLTTDSTASINDHMGKIYNLLDKEAHRPWAWRDAFREQSGLLGREYDDSSLGTLPYLLGDCLADSELRIVLIRLMNETQGHLRAQLSPLGIQGAAREATSNLSRAELMQLILICNDQTIANTIDSLVLQGDIIVPVGEIRRPVVNRSVLTGHFGIQVQLGPFGCRLHSPISTIGPLRLRKLVGGLYLADNPSDVSELEWQLREVDSATLSSRLEEYVRSFTPAQVVKRLVLARRTNMITACTELGIDGHRNWVDDDLVSAMLWKLDFDPIVDEDDNRRFWELHKKMKQVAQTAGVSALVDAEEIRGRASNYFVALEKLLDDCLAFATWALCFDHISSTRPFSYRATEDAEVAFRMLDTYEEHRNSGPEIIQFGRQRTLYPLCRGFISLARLLESRKTCHGKYVRSSEDRPRFVKHSTLKRFPFEHTVPFLDLLPKSQDAILAILEDVGARLVSADVNTVRNDQLHFRPSTTDLDRLSSSLDEVESSVRILEQSGLTRLMFRAIRTQADEWGRRVITLVDPRGKEIAIARPSSYDWLSLPSAQAPQYLVTSAVFAEPSEFLRFRSDLPSKYSDYWDNFPKRRPHSAHTKSVSTGNHGESQSSPLPNEGEGQANK